MTVTEEPRETSVETEGFRSIGIILLFYFGLFAFAFVVFVTAAHFLMEYSREKEHIEEHVAYVETVYGKIIAANAYGRNRQALQMNLDAIIRFDGIGFVAVWEGEEIGGTLLAEAGNSAIPSDMVKTFPVVNTDPVAGGPNGVTVEVRPSTASLLEQLKSKAFFVLLPELLIAAVFVMGIVILIRGYLVVPLLALSRFARTLDVETMDGTSSAGMDRRRRHHFRDELDVLREAFEDLRSRLRREKAERDTANALYRALFENTHVAMLAIDPENGQIIRANGAAERFYGWTRDELLTMSIAEINILPAEDVHNRMESARTTGQGYFEFLHRVADGSVRDVAVHSGIAAVDGDAVLHSVIFDITDRKLAERERDLTAFGMDRAALGVMRIREDDAVVESANAKACSLLGYTPEELIGMQVNDFDPNMDREAWVRHRRQVREAREHQFETVHRRRDGTEYNAEVTVAYIEYGGSEYSFSFFQDITERKTAEKRLVGLLREKEVLLREVHHRVRNNLLVMSSLTSLQTATIQSAADAHVGIEKIRDRIRAMSLAYSAIDEADDVSRVSLARYADGLVGYLRSVYAAGTPDTVTVEPSEVRVDLNKAIPLGLILNELVTNSLTHACTGSGTGRVTISFTPKAGATVEAVVADSGAGIPFDVLQAKQKPLGLMLVDMLADQLGGTVSYDVRHGTRVAVTFPVSEIEAVSDE